MRTLVDVATDIDPHARPRAAVVLTQRRDDGTARRLDGRELEERTRPFWRTISSSLIGTEARGKTRLA